MIPMPETKAIFLKLSSVPLTREKQIPLQEEFSRYGLATNWVMKILLKGHLTKRGEILDAIQDDFSKQFDNRRTYLNDILRSATAEIERHRKLAMTVRSMRDKTPFFKSGRIIFSQPIVKISEKALILTLTDLTRIPIPYDKFSRNQNAEKISTILKGESIKVDVDGKMPTNRRYGRIRMKWNSAGFLIIDIKANLPI